VGQRKSGMVSPSHLQALMASVCPPSQFNDWIFQKKGATIDTPSNLIAAQDSQQWIKERLLPADIKPSRTPTSNARFR